MKQTQYEFKFKIKQRVIVTDHSNPPVQYRGVITHRRLEEEFLEESKEKEATVHEVYDVVIFDEKLPKHCQSCEFLESDLTAEE